MIKAVDGVEIQKRSKGEAARRDIAEFLESEMESCEVVHEYKDNRSAYAAYYKIIRENNYSIKVLIRNDKLFLMKTKEEKKDA